MKKVNIGTYSKSGKLSHEESSSKSTHTKRSKKKTTRKRSSVHNKTSRKKLVTIFVLFLLLGLFGFGYLRLQEVNSRVERFDEQGNKVECTNLLNPECWTDAFRPQLKQSKGYTNALIIGLDTRKNGTSTLRNTDSIIFASFNHKTQKTMLISIPRDTYVPEYATKINAVYAYTSERDPKDPFRYLKETVSKIVGKPIHYFATVRFEGVVDGIDSIGGVKVCIEDSFTAQYPNDNVTAESPNHWFYYDFEAGCQNLSGERSMIYARFRYVPNGPAELASDFSRARRQQQIIEGVKDRLLKEKLSISERAEKYWGLLETFSESVHAYGMNFEDVLAGLSFIDTADRDPINIVLDPAFGGYNSLIYATSHPNAGYIIQARDASYASIQAMIDKVWEFSEFYAENPNVLVLNASHIPTLAADHKLTTLCDTIQFEYQCNFERINKSNQFTGYKVFSFSKEKMRSAQWLADYLGAGEVEEFPEQYGIERSYRNEDIIVVLGPNKIKETPTPTPTEEGESN